MRPTRPALAAIAVALAACAAPQPLPPQPPAPPPATPAPPAPVPQAFAADPHDLVFTDPERRKKIDAVLPSLDAMVEEEVRAQKLPGVVLGVVVDGELAYVKGFGVTDLVSKAKPDADTVYRIGSITKSFTALATVALRDDGKLSLDDPLTRFVPEAGGLVYPTRDTPPLTLRQLLTHTSGLPRLGRFDYTRPDRDVSEAEMTSSLAGLPLDNPPGTLHVYSNLGYGLLGLAASRAAGTSIRELIAAKILDPLGMTSTTFDRARVPAVRLATAYGQGKSGQPEPVPHWRLGAIEGAGGLYSTARDMARYLAFQLAAYPPRNAAETGAIRRSSVREAHFNGLRSSPLRVWARSAPAKGKSLVTARAGSYSYAWSLSDTCDFDEIVSHGGAIDGYAANIAFLPDRGVGVVVLANYIEADLDWLSERVLVALKKGGGLSQRALDLRLAAAFEPAMKRFLAVYNAWDEEAYGAMLGQGRPRLPGEKAELAGYKALHGACSGYVPIEILGPTDARFAMQCERGKLEMAIRIHAVDHLIMGFGGTSREVPPPEKLARAAARIAGLVKRWDERVYRKHLSGGRSKDHDKLVALYDRIRAAHGACEVRGFERTPETNRFVLACEHGGNLKLTVSLDDKNDEMIADHTLKVESPTTCPSW